MSRTNAGPQESEREIRILQAFKDAYDADVKAVHDQAKRLGLPMETLPSLFARIVAHNESLQAEVEKRDALLRELWRDKKPGRDSWWGRRFAEVGIPR